MNPQATEQFFDREFWKTENRRYLQPHFRLEKAARLLNTLAGGRQARLLDVGCGPAALAMLLDSNIEYRGIDIALQSPAPFLAEVDFVAHRIPREGAPFDFIVASGVFEYMGPVQPEKFAEIRDLLGPGGRFLVSYINFEHQRRVISPLYNNLRPIAAFRQELETCFTIERSFPVSYNWEGTPPRRPLLKRLEMHLNVNIPGVAKRLAVEYFFICRRSGQ